MLQGNTIVLELDACVDERVPQRLRPAARVEVAKPDAPFGHVDASCGEVAPSVRCRVSECAGKRGECRLSERAGTPYPACDRSCQSEALAHSCFSPKKGAQLNTFLAPNWFVFAFSAKIAFVGSWAASGSVHSCFDFVRTQKVGLR